MGLNKVFFFGLSFLLTFILIACSQNSPSQPETTFFDELQTALDINLAGNGGVGASMTIIMPDGELRNFVSGISHGTTPISPDMTFNIASVTKTFVAALILQLMEEETLSLDDSLHKWLSNYPNVDSTITIRQLLNHTSGVFDVWNIPNYLEIVSEDFSRRWTPEENIETFTLEPYSAPGEEFHYSNNGYILLGMIIEEATGSSVSAEIRNRFLEPLGLNHTFFAVEEEPVGNIAHGWRDINDDRIPDDLSTIPQTAFYSLEWTAGAMFSSAEDIAKWSQALFEGDVLNQSALNEMLNFNLHNIPGRATAGYGLGISLFFLNEFNGAESYGHGGENPGYRMSMLYFPNEDIHFIFMLNEANGECFWDIMEAVGAILFDR